MSYGGINVSNYESYRREVLECTQWLSSHGYFGGQKGSGGNVSVRIKGEEMIAVTPSSLPYQTLQVEDICIVNFALQTIAGEHRPSIEAAMHIGVYRHRGDVNAVIHTHQTFASVFAVLNMPVPPLFDEVALNTGHTIDVIPYALSGSPELVENVAGKLANKCHCYILQNHGALSLGATLEKAWINTENMEKAAQIYYYALSTGRPVGTLPEATLELFKALRG